MATDRGSGVWISVEFGDVNDPSTPVGDRPLTTYHQASVWWSDGPNGRRRPMAACGGVRMELSPASPALAATIEVENLVDGEWVLRPVTFEVDTLGATTAGWACALDGETPTAGNIQRLRAELVAWLQTRDHAAA
jgi:hypothetical protein